MKRIVCYFLCIAFMSSCKPEQAKAPVPFSFTVNNNNFSGSVYNATYNLNIYQFDCSLFVNDSSNHNYVAMSWSGNYYVSTGTYLIDSNYNHSSFNLIYVAGNNLYAGTSGTLTLTALDTINHKMSGSFLFTGVNVTNPTDTAKVTNGVFNNIIYSPQ